MIADDESLAIVRVQLLRRFQHLIQAIVLEPAQDACSALPISPGTDHKRLRVVHLGHAPSVSLGVDGGVLLLQRLHVPKHHTRA